MFFFDDLWSQEKGLWYSFFTIVIQLDHFLFANLSLALKGLYFVTEMGDIVLLLDFFGLKIGYLCLHDLVLDLEIHQQFL